MVMLKMMLAGQTQSTNNRYDTSVDNFNTVAHQILDSNKIRSIELVYGNT